MDEFKVGDYVRLTREWANELEHSEFTCKSFRPWIGSTFTITKIKSPRYSCCIRPLGGKESFIFGFEHIQQDVFLGNAQKAIRDAG